MYSFKLWLAHLLGIMWAGICLEASSFMQYFASVLLVLVAMNTLERD